MSEKFFQNIGNEIKEMENTNKPHLRQNEKTDTYLPEVSENEIGEQRKKYLRKIFQSEYT